MRKDALDTVDTLGDGSGDATARCPRCGAAFTCGMAAGLAACWCAELPVLASADKAATDCYCPACLRELLGLAAAPAPD